MHDNVKSIARVRHSQLPVPAHAEKALRRFLLLAEAFGTPRQLGYFDFTLYRNAKRERNRTRPSERK
jgi:hypothetical protein